MKAGRRRNPQATQVTKAATASATKDEEEEEEEEAEEERRSRDEARPATSGEAAKETRAQTA